MKAKRIGILAYDDADLLDIGGPAKVFHQASEQLVRAGSADAPVYEVEFLSRDGGPIRTEFGARLETTGIGAVRPSRFDTVLVSGSGATAASGDPVVLDWLRQASTKVRRLGSTCTGAFVLAAAGLLDGRRAATHWAYCRELQAAYPAVRVDAESIYVEDGLWTSAGVTSGMDMALAMVEQDFGRELALQTARLLVIFLKRPGGQSQFSAPLQSQSAEGALASLLEWILANPAADLRTEQLAERAHMSLRNFHRAFHHATSTSPAEWVEMARLEEAKRLLEQTGLHVDQVALRAGFIQYERMRRVFGRRLGITPGEYRDRFARPAPTRDPAVELPLRRSAARYPESLA